MATRKRIKWILKKSAQKQAERGPIASGNAFLGLCNTRGIALQLFDKRVFQILAANLAGFIGIILWLATDPHWLLLLALMVGVVAFLVLLKMSLGIFRGSAARVDYWTKKIIENEEVNGVEGGIQMFSSAEYAELQKVPALPAVHLMWIVRACMVMWVVIGLIALVMFLDKTGVVPWKWWVSLFC